MTPPYHSPRLDMGTTGVSTRGALNTLQAGRAFAAVIVLLFHAHITLALPQYLDRSIFPVFKMGYSGVHFFFVLSGFVIMLAHGRDIGRPDRLGVFAWKRFRRIYPPLWAALLLVTPAVLLLPAISHNTPLDLAGILSSIALTPSNEEPLLTVAWTLRHEMLFYAVFGLAIWRPRIGLPVAATWLGLSAILPWTGLSYPLVFFFTSQHLLFAFGALAFVAFERGWVRWPAALLIGGLALFAVTWSLPLLKLPLNGIIGNWAFGLGAAMAILGAAALERSRGFPVPRWLVFLGEASYAIYLIHAPVLYLVMEVAMRLPARPSDGVLFWIVAALGLAAGVVFHVVVERPILRMLTRPATTAKADPAAGAVAP